MGIWIHRRPTAVVFQRHQAAVWSRHSAGQLCPGAVAVLETARRNLLRRIPVTGGANHRTDRVERNSTGWRVSLTNIGGARLQPLLEFPDRVLVDRVGQPGVAIGLPRWGRVRDPAGCGISTENCANCLLCPVPFADHGRTEFPVLPMGHPAPGNRIPGDLSWILAADRLVVPMAAVPLDAPLRRCKAVERRHDLAKPGSTEVSLLHAASAQSRGLVHASASWMVSRGVNSGDVRDRGRHGILDLCAETSALLRRLLHCFSTGDDFLDRELYLFQPAGDNALRPVAR